MNNFLKTVKLILRSHEENVRLGDTLREMNGYLVGAMNVIGHFWLYTFSSAIEGGKNIDDVVGQSIDDGVFSGVVSMSLDAERESAIFPIVATASSWRLKVIVFFSLLRECWKRRATIGDLLKASQDADEHLRAMMEKKVHIIREACERVARLQPAMAVLSTGPAGIEYSSEMAKGLTDTLERTSKYLISNGHVDEDRFGFQAVNLQDLFDCGLSLGEAVAFVSKYVTINSTEMLEDLKAALKAKDLRPFTRKYPCEAEDE